jgi:hypothetical protein
VLVGPQQADSAGRAAQRYARSIGALGPRHEAGAPHRSALGSSSTLPVNGWRLVRTYFLARFDDLTMFCPRCGRPVDEGAAFCPSCGASVAPSGGPAPLASASESASSRLMAESHLVMVWDKLSLMTNFRFQDTSGAALGQTQGEVAFPIKYTLFDESGKIALVLDASRVRGLMYDYLVHDGGGAVLASLRQQSSLLSRKYSITVGERSDWVLTTDAAGYHYSIDSTAAGTVIATGDRRPAIRTSMTDIRITAGESMDHRIIVGSMILACYLTTRGH